MKRSFVLAVIFVLFSIPSFAAKNSQSFNLAKAVKAGSVELTPGDYDVTWTGSGSDVQVTFALKKKVIATVPAKLTEEYNKNEGLETDNRGGVDVLETIRIRNATLRFEESPSSAK
jgi:hypothetical protein